MESSKNRLTRRDFLILILGLTCTDFTSLTQLSRNFGRQETWPNTPLFNELLKFYKLPFNGKAYLEQTEKTIPFFDEELPSNISSINMSLLWTNFGMPLDELAINKDLNGLSYSTSRPSQSLSISEQLKEIEETTTSPFSDFLIRINYSFLTQGSTHSSELYVNISQEAQNVRIFDDFFETDTREIGSNLNMIYDKNGNLINSKQFFYVKDKNGNLLIDKEEAMAMYVNISDFYNNKAKEANR